MQQGTTACWQQVMSHNRYSSRVETRIRQDGPKWNRNLNGSYMWKTGMQRMFLIFQKSEANQIRILNLVRQSTGMATNA